MEIKSILIKDTTKEERERIVAESIGYINGSCDGCASGLIEMYQDYIDGKKEIAEINRLYAPGGDHNPVLTEARKDCPKKLKER